MAVVRMRRGDRGAAAVEFALVLPVLLLIIFGIVDFGRMLAAKITLTEAAREGARAAALVSQEEGEATVFEAVADLDDPIETPVVVGCPDAPAPGDDATATVTYRFTFITPVSILFGSSGDGHVDLVASGLMPCMG